MWFGALSRFWSPYDLNPLNINPLKDVIDRFVDFEEVRKQRGLELFISATDVHTGELRIFTRKEISPEVVMASACLPLLFRAVEIGGVPYWDGGYSGNPASAVPAHDRTEDTLIVQINPLRRPRRADRHARDHEPDQRDQIQRVALVRAARGRIRQQLIDEGRLPRGTGAANSAVSGSPYRARRCGQDTGARNALNTDFEYFETLHKLGQRAMRRFLDAHFDSIGRRSTIDAPRRLRQRWLRILRARSASFRPSNDPARLRRNRSMQDRRPACSLRFRTPCSPPRSAPRS